VEIRITKKVKEALIPLILTTESTVKKSLRVASL